MKANSQNHGVNGNSDNNECIAPIILSKEATHEILGENLSSVIAIGKDGKPVLYLPHGAETGSEEHRLTEDETTVLDITIRVPKG